MTSEIESKAQSTKLSIHCKIKMDNDSLQVFNLGAKQELQLEQKTHTQVFLELKEGSAEIFGTELVRNKRYNFPNGCKIAVFTWNGCTLHVSKPIHFTRVKANDLMDDYRTVHDILQQWRQKAEDNRSNGPTVLVCGPTFVGKSTVCRILLNYAVRAGRNPVFVDLDVNQGQIALPGTIGVAFVRNVAHVRENFSCEPSCVYHYGHTSPGDDMDLYTSLISCIAEDVSIHAQNNHRNLISGTIIDTCGWLPGDKRESVKYAVDAFDVDVVLVIDQARLYCEFINKLPRSIRVFTVGKISDEIRSDEENGRARDNIIRGYFYGLKKRKFLHSLTIKFSDIEVSNIGEKWLSYDDMPFKTAHDKHAELFPVRIGTNLLHHVLSVMLPMDEEEDSFYESVRGFVCVTDVNMKTRKLKILYREPELPRGAILLMSDVQHVNQL